ncbi:hypothetical protein CEXT_687111 [Caerostris extrusa]|uniref:Uncharacterized protein n=1 Tax=Caerostris extrusa TaxID=172846 RepID=A0AAV4NFN1_CAEEX|nr:hypothetical protein CEXT_687111 [Caerostris extrusa]
MYESYNGERTMCQGLCAKTVKTVHLSLTHSIQKRVWRWMSLCACMWLHGKIEEVRSKSAGTYKLLEGQLGKESNEVVAPHSIVNQKTPFPVLRGFPVHGDRNWVIKC